MPEDEGRSHAADGAEPTAAPPFAPPALTLPKGGGAIRGIGEKFSANPATGTGSLTIPLPATPGRSGFGPSLALAYDSGAAHGPFGMGWSVGLPTITRKTDRGVPTYGDAAESDVFVLSGAEDLVPTVGADGQPLRWPHPDHPQYSIVRYRPRVEGLYARVERWTHMQSGETHWRSISRDNVTTLYGTDAGSRIADPADPVRRVFSWLIAESFDTLGNVVVYGYKPEDDANVDRAAANERHRIRTANRYLKSVRYGNRTSRLVALPAGGQEWLFELVFDYGEHEADLPTAGPSWPCRNDPFSSYRAGFEIRTYRLCQRILMFHHFPQEAPAVGANCLVRSMRLRYRSSRGVDDDARRGDPAGAFLASVEVTGHRRQPTGEYVERSLPPLEMTYSTAQPDPQVHDLAPGSLENLPEGLAGDSYTLVDLDGESIAGVVSEQAGAWHYKPNLGEGRLGAVQSLPQQPSTSLRDGRSQLLDLAGDGSLDLVAFDRSHAGYFERTAEGGWSEHRQFRSLPAVDWGDANLQFADLSGDGHADVLVTGDDGFVWYPSLGEEGFAPPVRVPLSADEESGPRLVMADGSRSIHLADMSGDGLSDLVRIRNGEVCYWPNLGHGRFGAKVVMDRSPWFDRQDGFDQRRIRLADVDGTGLVDIVYLGGDGVDLYLNQMGNAWSAPQRLPAFPPVDDVSTVTVVDLLGRGTACLVWSSSLPGDAGRQIRYVDLMGVKPHLLIRARNNLGAETAVTYASSTSFYLRDKASGRPWITRLPFPVHVVERVETFDWISRNRFVTRYAYHHGHFDGSEREFRGFGMVEQFDTEHMAALSRSTAFPIGDNVDEAGHMPPVLTKTWFHTGASVDRLRISTLFADEYYDGVDWLLDDTPLPEDLSTADEHEACRALKGRPLRREVYALDGTVDERHPYTVVESNYSVERLQAVGERHGVFAVHPRDTVTVTCERSPGDPRVAHELVLAVDRFGSVTHSATVAYGRGRPDESLPLRTRDVQAKTLMTETRAEVTEAIDTADAYRAPAPHDVRTLEITGTSIGAGRPLLERRWIEQTLTGPLPAGITRRLVDRRRTRFQADDLSGPLDWGQQAPRGLPHETYRLVFTPDVLSSAFGSRVNAAMLTAAGYVPLAGCWWAPSGTARFAPETTPDALAFAREHFFVARRLVDAFGAETLVEYDDYDLLPVEVVDAVGNQVTAGQRDADDIRLGRPRLDYRVLAPVLLTDPNRNRTAVLFDALGLVTATAVMGKPEDDTGGRVDGLDPDPPVAAFWPDPLGAARDLLGAATTRMLYDLDAYRDTRDDDEPLPVGVSTIARERHAAAAGGPSPVQVSFSYSDGAGREIQQRLPAEPEAGSTAPRWIASGWEVLNNKGLPVRRYEPSFSQRHTFEFGVKAGVSSVLCYDPVGRVVATVNPNHTYAKTVIGAWQQETWDVNDTATHEDPAADGDVGAYIARLDQAEYLPTWHEQRIDGGLGPHEQKAAERTQPHSGTPTLAALDPLGRPVLTVARNRTPRDGLPPLESDHRTHVVLDIEGDQVEVADCTDGTPGLVTAAADRLVARFSYDLAGAQLVEESMEAGTRRTLADVAGNAVASWEKTGESTPDRHLATHYDPLRRPVAVTLNEGASTKTVGRTEYGEDAPDPSSDNLRGQVAKTYDGAGTVAFAYDVQGNTTRTTRRLASEYREVVDWTDPSEPELEDDVWTSRTSFDVLNRLTEETHPDGTVVRHGYNAGGLLETITAQLADDADATRFVTGIEYDAKGQRLRIDYGNGVHTSYGYDEETFRLSALVTRRAGFADDEPVPPDTRRGVQNLSYVYDPAGNITHIQDDAQPRVFYLNTQVDASCDYTYDALYRLVDARGREHLGLIAGSQAPTSWNDDARINPADRNALGRYRERYGYDPAGNLTAIDHDSSHPLGGWERAFTYDEPSQLEPAKRSNRLTSTQDGTQPKLHHGHDSHGNMDRMAWLTHVRWDYHDRLGQSSRQTLTVGVAETTHYLYDGTGERVHKITDRPGASIDEVHAKSERIYLGDFEDYRERDPAGDLTLARSTVHIMDDEQRVAMVEAGSRGPAVRLIRYQCADHLGSATVELDDAAALVSYEEYYPYGGAALSLTKKGVTPKRYRLTRKERDEETGMTYHRARYYCPWLGRWTACDPNRRQRPPALYTYCQNAPTVLRDLDGAAPEPVSWGLSVRETIARAHVNVAAARADRAARAHGVTSPEYQTAKEVERVGLRAVATAEAEKAFHRAVGEDLAYMVTGDFSGRHPTGIQTLTMVGVGTLPVVGLMADVRDISSGAIEVGNHPTAVGAWTTLSLSTVAVVPIWGDLVKGGAKLARPLNPETRARLLDSIMCDRHRSVVYRLLDVEGNVLRYGTTNDAVERYGKYLRGEIAEVGYEFKNLVARMEVVASDADEAAARALESDLIKEAFSAGLEIYNQVSETGRQWVGRMWDPHTLPATPHIPVEVPRPVSPRGNY